jgi:hypothetical protein
MPLSNPPRTMRLPVLKFDPKKGSFWEKNMGSQNLMYVHPDDDTSVCIGEISRVARSRYRWSRYEKPVPITSTRKHRPTIAEHHVVPRVSSAFWALALSDRNNRPKGVKTDD